MKLNEKSNQIEKDRIDIDSEILNQVLNFKKEITDLNITNSTFSKFNLMMRPILIWISHSKNLIKTYYKSLDLQQTFNHLNLLEP